MRDAYGTVQYVEPQSKLTLLGIEQQGALIQLQKLLVFHWDMT